VSILKRRSEPFDPNTKQLDRLVRFLGPVGTRLTYDEAVDIINRKLGFDLMPSFDRGAAPRPVAGAFVDATPVPRDFTRARGLLAALEWAGLIERVSQRPQLRPDATEAEAERFAFDQLIQPPEYDPGVLVVEPPTPADRAIVEEPTVSVYDADGNLVEVKRSQEGEFLNEQRRVQARRRADALRRDLAELKALEAEGF
jgi:hypothetical protein